MPLVNKQEQEVARDWLIGILAEGVATVTFNKKDGTERVMKCTLQKDLVEYDEKKTDRTKPANPEVLPVYDVEAEGWRSFRMDAITKVEFNIGGK